ncbi:rhodanese-like domain-containing protein [Paractinoplanes toevensis]|uniref:thiosulfate sulfurtransferase n=1 Tax=Paractinoplanes toevensis TaxID=571911 RepID=A0A919T691_9ACTN|nr:rhodanese-like domain-containing protein [Actinoplanes toevensis]GIM89805.1 sulfurtransferase [Actinoplanes toevensis]
MPINAVELHKIIEKADEYALVDVREARVTAEQGSILLGVPIPLSVLELKVDALIPRRNTPVIVYDGGDEDLAARAAARLETLGYTDVEVLDGGLEGWAAAGYKVQTGGDHVIGQAFGEWIEEVYATPHLSVPDYLAKIENGEDIVLLDSRPIGEFENHSLPGGTSVPGAELVYRAAEVVKSPDSLVVVNCAGRTRSILGAQLLINAGLPNRVVSLERGTQSWVLEGHPLDHGKHEVAPLPTGAALDAARAAADRFRARFGIRTVDQDTLRRFHDEAGERSLYVLDVRTPEEYAAGHLPGTTSAPSWDVAPWVFRYIATHHARIVLVDNDEVRATVAASWIEQFGWGEVFVLANPLDGQELETGPVPTTALDVPSDIATTTEAAGTVIDLRPSHQYRKGHIPGAAFAIRARLTGDLPGTGPIVLVSEDGLLARYAARDLAALTDRPVRVLEGRPETLVEGDEIWLHEPDDVVASGWRETDPELRKAGFRRYLSWELGLVEELNADDTVPFRSFAEDRP